ncbi:MAG: DUF167 domain-containing protein [Planctomycetes bacterium]|nr:DUF167 domain-containing protein [Planctomycetota bacterium]
MIELRDHADGVIVPVHAQAGARADALRGVRDGALKVSVTQAPEKGKANKAIVALLCDKLSLKRSQCSLLAGETAARKKFLVRAITAKELAQRIRRQLDD